MGMSASQARFLCITARISDNEMKQQSLAYSKQRLAEKSSYANEQYLEALDKTKYQILTGYNGSEACYADVSFNQLTGLNSVACGKQYLVKANSGKVLVSSDIAEAYASCNGDFNKFLKAKGLTQSDINVNSSNARDLIHNAWDNYLASVGKSINDYESQHILGFGYTAFSKESFDGYPTYNTTQAIKGNSKIELFKDQNGYYMNRNKIQARMDADGNYYCAYQTVNNQGTNIWNILNDVEYNAEDKKFTYKNDNFKDENGNYIKFDALYADLNAEGLSLISDSPKNYFTPASNGKYAEEGGREYTLTNSSKALNFEGTTQAQRELYDYALSITEAYYNNNNSHSSTTLKYDAQAINYYKNIFNEMRTCGYTTVNETFGRSDEKTDLKDPEWFVKQVKAGKLVISYYSSVEKSFINTSLDDDESIAEKEDKSAMVVAEQVYKTAMDTIEAQDKQFDLELNRLESEHNALTTEYDAVQKVLKENVEKSFKTFNS